MYFFMGGRAFQNLGAGTSSTGILRRNFTSFSVLWRTFQDETQKFTRVKQVKTRCTYCVINWSYMLNLSIIATPHDRESSVPHFYDLPFHQRQLFRNQRIICVDKYLKIHAALQKCRFLPFNGSVGLHIHIPKTPSISRIDLCRLHILFSPNSKLQKSLAC